jgi:hypothetical protein
MKARGCPLYKSLTSWDAVRDFVLHHPEAECFWVTVVGSVSLDPEVVRDLGLELDVEAQLLAARVLRLARIAERSAEV